MRFITNFIDIRRDEWKGVILAFCWFFFLMSAYNLLRPIRETFATKLGSAVTARLFIAVFVVMLMAVPLFAWLVKTCSKPKLVMTVFHFFAANLLIFGAINGTTWDGLLYQMVFFVWVSVFILFVVSLLWSVLADTFSNEQAKRLFGPIASGATLGSMAGSLFTSHMATEIGTRYQLFLACSLLEVSLLFAWWLQRVVAQSSAASQLREPQLQEETNIFNDLTAGLREISKSRYLQMICLYIVLAQLFGTFVYFLLNETVKAKIVDPAARTAHFGGINFATQAGTLIMQTIILGQVVKRFGISVALVIWPLVSLACIYVVGVSPTLIAVSAVDVFNRVANYGISVPAKEMLFTVVGKDAKYKSKSFIDTVVVRGSDAVSANLYTAISSFLVLGTICVGLVPLVLGGAIAGWWLGVKRKQLAEGLASPQK
jgi:AAA family ATP:ADP antiporter